MGKMLDGGFGTSGSREGTRGPEVLAVTEGPLLPSAHRALHCAAAANNYLLTKKSLLTHHPRKERRERRNKDDFRDNNRKPHARWGVR